MLLAVSTSQGRLGDDPEETCERFLITCPRRLSLWTRVCQTLYRADPDVEDIIRHLSAAPVLNTNADPPYVLAISAVLLHFSAYWQYIFQAVPSVDSASTGNCFTLATARFS